MNSRRTLIPAALVAISLLGFAGTPGTARAATDSPACVQSCGTVSRAPASDALGAAERAGLERATLESPRLEALRGGEVSDHDLSVALLVVGIVLIVLII
jgi:hypothetical protein